MLHDDVGGGREAYFFQRKTKGGLLLLGRKRGGGGGGLCYTRMHRNLKGEKNGLKHPLFPAISPAPQNKWLEGGEKKKSFQISKAFFFLPAISPQTVCCLSFHYSYVCSIQSVGSLKKNQLSLSLSLSQTGIPVGKTAFLFLLSSSPLTSGINGRLKKGRRRRRRRKKAIFGATDGAILKAPPRPRRRLPPQCGSTKRGRKRKKGLLEIAFLLLFFVHNFQTHRHVELNGWWWPIHAKSDLLKSRSQTSKPA